MTEKGIVRIVEGDRVEIEIMKSVSKKCIKCGLCSDKGGEKVIEIYANNLKIGDSVIINIHEGILIIYYLISFGIPLLTMMMAMIAGYMLYGEVLSILCALIGLAMGVYLSGKIDKKKMFYKNLYKIEKEDLIR